MTQTEDSAPNSYTIDDLPIAQVAVVRDHNPREVFDEAKLQELADSIREHGLLQSLVVRELDVGPGGLLRYRLIAGERRLRAARLAGLATVPVRVVEVADEQAALRLALEENLRREDLNPIEQARALARLNRELGVKQREIAEATHSSQPAVANRIRLLELPEDVQGRIATGELSEAHGVALARFSKTPGVASKLATMAVQKRATAKDLADGIPWSWELEQAGLLKCLDGRATWGAECKRHCPHEAYRAGTYAWPFCLNPECFAEKARAAAVVREAEAEKALQEAKKTNPKAEVLDTSKLPYDSFRNLADHKPPAGCREDCPSRAPAVYWQGTTTICTDTRCWKRLEMAAKKAANKAKKADVAEKVRLIAERCAGIEEPAEELDFVNSAGEIVTQPWPFGSVGSRELAVLVWYALRQTSGDARDLVHKAAGLEPGDAEMYPGRALAALAELRPAKLVRLAIEAILRYEQNERLKEYTSAGAHASEFFFEGEEVVK